VGPIANGTTINTFCYNMHSLFAWLLAAPTAKAT